MSETPVEEEWAQPLLTFLTVVEGPLDWMLVGSAATRLHGVDLVPGDVDVLIHPDATDAAFAQGCRALAAFAARGPAVRGLEDFVSTQEHPLVASEDGTWLFGRWMIAGRKLEVARIRSATPAGLLTETLGPAVWESRQHIEWHRFDVPVVPLEVQYATCRLRGNDARAREVGQRLHQRGHDADLLARALADRGLADRGLDAGAPDPT
ncbi:hypothetical protein [Occultella kanbiaonis]|uniref:hypothetical protein n=1 Tax=Occultella kanbiaonis TaxID=2675754 RepID=UPI0012B7D0C4|nr:hypothetical protein [Occultella kanbiaonis]